MNTKDIITEANSALVEERAMVVDSLRSLNAPNEEGDRKWAVVAQRRLQEFCSGAQTAVPGNEVFRQGGKSGRKASLTSVLAHREGEGARAIPLSSVNVRRSRGYRVSVPSFHE